MTFLQEQNMVESSDELARKWLHSVALRRKDCDLTSTMF